MNVALGGYYSENGMSLAITICRFPQDYNDRPLIRAKALRYLFSHRSKYRKAPSFEDLTKSGSVIFQEYARSNNLEGMREIADIMSEYNGNEAELYLNRVREAEHLIVPAEDKNGVQNEGKNRVFNETKKVVKKTVYSDSQNVHNSKINKTVLRCLETLFSKHSSNFTLDSSDVSEKFEYKVDILRNIGYILISDYPQKTELINSNIDYIIHSTAIFGKKELGMIDAFLSLWFYIENHPQKKDLVVRLLEEMKEMKGHCTTGHLSRLMNVIQGFTDDENLCIRISDSDQCNAVVKQYLTKELQNCTNEEVLEGMTTGNDAYKKYIRQSIAKKLLEWKAHYGQEMLDHIAKIVNSFTNTTVFS